MKPQTRKLIIEGTLIVVLFVLIVVSVTVAWFTGDNNVDVSEFIIEVKSSDNFQLSLDGVNFSNTLTINLDNKAMNVDDEEYNSSVQLSDLASILTSESNDQNTKTYQHLNLYDPIRNEDTGEPITETGGVLWYDAVKSKIIKAGEQYYLSSSSISALAQYLELDIWVRSDSNLSIYLGSDSTIYPVTTVDESAAFTPAMASKRITVYGYEKTVYTDKTNGKTYGFTIVADDGKVYVFKSNEDEGNTVNNFVVKTKQEVLHNPNTDHDETFTCYYSSDDNYIIKSKEINTSLKIYGTTEELGQCNEFSDEDGKTLFYVKYNSDGFYTSKYVYNSVRQLIDQSDYETFFNGYDQGFVQYLSMYKFDSFNFMSSVNNYGSSIETYYYDEKGELLDKIITVNGVATHYNKNNEIVSEPSKPYQVLKESYYGTEDLETIDDVFITKSTKYTFSKNLAAGAALVSFSEMVTDDFNENNKVIQKEVEDLKILWNPLPEFSLVNQGTTSKYVYDANREETLSYYDYDSENSTYTLTNFASDNSLIKVGDFITNSQSVGNGETPVLETEVASGDKFCIKKMRVKIWLDGNDSMATNSMLNSSTAGTGQIKMSINLVANINSTYLTYEPYYTKINDVPTLVPGKYIVTANKSNGKISEYDFSVSGTWVNEHGNTIAIAEICDSADYPILEINQRVVSFYRYGDVTVFARSEDGRVGSVNLTYDYVKFFKIYDDATPNQYKVIAVDANLNKSVDEITVDDYVKEGVWQISDENIATTSVDSNGALIVSFSAGGEEIITYSCIKYDTLNYQEYSASNNIRINHSYVIEGGE